VAPADTLLSPRDALIRNSPMTYAHRIRTPLLILHGSQDLRTGVSQSERLYRTLKVLERPVEYVRYPGAGHDLSRSGAPIQRLDRVLRIHEFFARYVDLPSGSPDDSRAASRP
jgi:dipeptidyl aminopeptidase/acylaminoacyl peptidase